MNSTLKTNKNFSCFVTGTDTEIGKTLISCTLLHALGQSGTQAVGMKPVAAGAQLRGGVWHNEDADALAQASTLELPSSLTSPYVFRDAIAPHLAAMHEGISMDCAHILDCYAQIAVKADAVVVEGVGGFRVPLSDQFDTADLAQQLALPVVLVVGLRLGCINHALLTADAIAARGLKLVGWVANTVDNQMPFKDENVDTLRGRLPAPLLGIVPRLALPSAAKVAQYLDFTGLSNWPSIQG